MKRTVLTVRLAATLTLAWSAHAVAGQSITIGGATYSTGPAPTQTTAWGPASDLTAPITGTDQLYQDWWWLRVGNASRESALVGPGAISPSGTSLTFDTAQSGLGARATWSLATTPGGVTLSATLRLTNSGTSPITLQAFHYADIDVNGSWSDDVVSVAGPGVLQFTDAAGQTGQGPYAVRYSATGNASFGVGELGSLITQLTDGAATNFNSSLAGWSGGPTDLAAGWQWNLTIAAGGSATIGVTMAVVPSPAPAGALALAAGLLASRRRRA